MISDTVIQAALIVLGIIAAAVSLILAKVELRDKRKRYLGFRPKDLKSYTAYISFLSAILLIYLQTKKDINTGNELLQRYRYVDSVDRWRFDSTLAAINVTLTLQQATMDSTDSILKRQIIELQNQQLTLEANNKIIKGQDHEFVQLQRLIAEQDAITKSQLHFEFEINNAQTADTFSNFYLSHPYLRQCAIDYGNGNFAIRDTCVQKFPAIVNSVNIFFADKKLGSKKVESLFLKDTVSPDVTDNYLPPISSRAYFKHFSPQLSLGTASLDRYSNFYCYKSAHKMSGIFYYRTVIMSRENNPEPFSGLDQMIAIVVVNTPLENLSVSNIYLNNNLGNKKIIFTLEKTIMKRLCKASGENVFYQTIFLATIENGLRKD